MKQQLILYSTSSTVLIKLSATNRTDLSTKLPEVDIVDTNLQKDLYTDSKTTRKIINSHTKSNRD
jgi:hypothetical protein